MTNQELKDRTLEQLEAQYFLLKFNYDDLYEACNSDQQKIGILQDQYRTAHRNYLRTINEVLSGDSQAVNNLIKDIGDANEKITESLKGLKDISAVLGVITAGVQVGTALATAFV